MARKYPTYAFFNPQNTKSPGPFCIRLIPPRFIARVDRANAKGVELSILDSFETGDLRDVTDEEWGQMAQWLKSQIMAGEISEI